MQSGVSRVWRMAVNLRRGFVYGRASLREPITSTGAIAAVTTRMRGRADAFLDTVERAIFANPGSPYRPLLAAAGYDLTRLRALVHRVGVEAALRALCQDGGYVSIEEFKGLRNAHRGAHTFRFDERDFHNPLIHAEFHIQSGATQSLGIRSPVPVADLRLYAEHQMVALAAHGLEGLPIAVWFPQMERVSLLTVMAFAAMRHVPGRWVTQLPEWRLDVDETHAFYVGIRLAAWVLGLTLPRRTYVPFGEEAKSLPWIAEQDQRRGCVVTTIPSVALRVALAARQEGIRWPHVTFVTGGEALTSAKSAAICAIGARPLPRFAFSEFGVAAYGCATPASADEMHVCNDVAAVIQRRRPADRIGSEVDALLFTSLRPEARRILLNMETGDYAKLTTRRCGCLLERLGWTEHLEEVRSFEKLNLESWAFLGAKLIALVEEVLPARFGGNPTDYQLVEHEAQDGQTRLTVIVHPRLGAIEEPAVLACVEEALDVSPSWVGARVYRRLETLQVRRAAPMPTPAGKVMPLHHLGRGQAGEAAERPFLSPS